MKDEYVYPNDFGMEPSRGLTKREYFAALIMANMVCSAKWEHHPWFDIAEQAAKAADALLEELKP